jgi:hypothetical protein
VPIKSKAQRRKFAQLLVEGKIRPETYEEWNRSAGNKRLPERVRPKDRRSSQSKRRTTRAKSAQTRQAKSKRKSR